MINNIQNSFSIQDLEVLSGIKAHTIRIWEKRYGLLNPTRLNRNIRVYSLLDLQKILNVSLLQNHNYKISKLAKLTEEELENKAKEVSLKDFSSNYHINALLISMFTLDEALFEKTYQTQVEKESFKEIFVNTYLPLLKYIGTLWQTKGIRPAQEHFISNLIYQKIVLNIALISAKKATSSRTNILFLPEGEIHEMGLLYMIYHLKCLGEKTIYLGRDVPISDLIEISSQFEEINWICSFTIDRTDEEKLVFITEIEKLLEHTKNTCCIVGSIWKNFKEVNKSENIRFYEGFQQLTME